MARTIGTLTLPMEKATKNAVLYGLGAGMAASHPFSSIYVRKDALRQPGQAGWPATIMVTVEVAE